MAEAEDQQSFVAHNGDQVPDQGIDEMNNDIQYQVHDETLGHQPYQVQDPILEPQEYEVQEQTLEPQEYEVQDQTLEPQQYEVQDQTLEPQKYEVQDQTLEPQQYAVQDQLEYQDHQVQDQANEEVQNQPLDEQQYQPLDEQQYQPQDQEQYQLQDEAHDQAQYQVEGEAQDHNGDEVQDQVVDEEGIPEHAESLLISEPEGGATVGVEEKRWPGWPGETVFRMLVPAQKVGSIIGRKGDVIKKIVEETRARIKILDGPPGTTERAVSSCKFHGNKSIIGKVSNMKSQR